MRAIKPLFKRGGIYKINLSDYLKKFLKNNVKEKIEFEKYLIYLFYKEGGSGYGDIENKRIIYFDTHYNFVLLHDREPICSIGFNRRFIERSTIFVKQIQGVRGKQKELSPFRWEKMLLQILIDWARKNRFKRINVIRSVDHEYYSAYDEEKNRRMHMKYDVTARRMGFKYDEKRGVYYAQLKKKSK